MEAHSKCSVCSVEVVDPVIACAACFSAIGQRGASLLEELKVAKVSNLEAHDELVSLAQKLDQSAVAIEKLNKDQRKMDDERKIMSNSIDEYVDEIAALKSTVKQLEVQVLSQKRLAQKAAEAVAAEKKLNSPSSMSASQSLRTTLTDEKVIQGDREREAFSRGEFYQAQMLQLAAENETLIQQRDDERKERLRVERLLAVMTKEKRRMARLDSPAPQPAPVSEDLERVTATLHSAASLLEELEEEQAESGGGGGGGGGTYNEEEEKLTAYRNFCQSCVEAINEELLVTHPGSPVIEYLEYYYRATRAVVPLYQVYTWIRATVFEDLGISKPSTPAPTTKGASRSLMDILFSGRKRNKAPPVQGWLICRGGDFSWQQRWVHLSDRLDISVSDSSDNPYSQVLASFALSSIQEVCDASELRERAFRIRLSDGRVLFFATLTPDAFHLWINAIAKLC